MFVRKRPCLGFTALILCAGALVIVHRSTRIGNQILCVNEENTLGAGDGFQSTIKMHICGPVYPSFKDNATRHYLQSDNKRTKKETSGVTNTLKESNDHIKTLKDDGIDEKAKNNGLSNVLKVNRVQFVKVKHKGSQEDKVITSAKQGNIQKDDQSTSQRVKHKENPKGDKENARKTNQQKLYKSKVNTTTLINSHSKEHSVDVNDVLHKTRNASPTNPQSELRPKRKQEGEIRQIVFAKIHKAASSTLQNLLLRFAMARNLNVLLPTRQDHINEFGSYIDEKEIIAHPENKPFDVLCNHLVFNANEIARFIPNSAFRFGILREPLSQTISAVQYYATHFLSQGNQMLTAALKYKTDPIQGFLNHPHDFCNKRSSLQSCMVDNRMSMDLGFDYTDMYISKRNKTKILAFIDQVDRQFDLMLIYEHFDASLILLRRRLNWPMKDILYIKINVAASATYHSRRNVTLSLDQKKTFEAWDAVDIALYAHFLKKFENQIQKEKFINEELGAFQAVQAKVSEFCQTQNSTETTPLTIPASNWTKRFSMTAIECQNMMLSEVDIVKKARDIQLARFARMKASGSR